MTKDVRGKVSEATDSITQKARDDVVDVAGKKLKQKVVDDKWRLRINNISSFPFNLGQIYDPISYISVDIYAYEND